MNFIINPQNAFLFDSCDLKINCGSATCVGDCPKAAGCGINR